MAHEISAPAAPPRDAPPDVLPDPRRRLALAVVLVAGSDERTTAVLTRAAARANAQNYSYAYGGVLLLAGGALLIVSAGFLTLPKRARRANPLLDPESPPESDPITVGSANLDDERGVLTMNVLVLGRERILVDASTAIIEENGFRAVGVTRDDEAFALLDTGQFAAVLVGGGVEFASRPLVRRRAAAHGTVVLESRRMPMQTIQDHVRNVIVPRLRQLN